MRTFKIGDVQESVKKEQQDLEKEKAKRKAMLESFKKHGNCPDYNSEKCTSMLGVYCCWDTEEHKKYKCPVIDYSE